MHPIFCRPRFADELAQRLLRPTVLDEGLRSGLFLSGLRGTGKSTFATNDLIPALEEREAIVIYVDLWSDTTANPAQLTLEAIREAFRDLQDPESHVLARLRRTRGASQDPLRFTFGPDLERIGAKGGLTLAQALSELADGAKTDVVLIMDEVQQAVTTGAGRAMLLALKAARDAINARTDMRGHFVFVGIGSHPALVKELTVRSDHAFVGAVSIALPPLGDEFVDHVLARLVADGVTSLPSCAAAIESFRLLRNRPIELLKAFRHFVALLPSAADADQTIGIISRTLRCAAADVELAALEGIGGLAVSVFGRIASTPSGQSLFSAAAAVEYSRAIRRSVRIEEIQPVVKELLRTNLISRHGHGSYVVSDPSVQEQWLERSRLVDSVLVMTRENP